MSYGHTHQDGCYQNPREAQCGADGLAGVNWGSCPTPNRAATRPSSSDPRVYGAERARRTDSRTVLGSVLASKWRPPRRLALGERPKSAQEERRPDTRCYRGPARAFPQEDEDRPKATQATTPSQAPADQAVGPSRQSWAAPGGRGQGSGGQGSGGGYLMGSGAFPG